MYEKTSPRSDLRWKPTGRIFKIVGLRWIPTGKLFDSCTGKVDSEPPHGSNVDISKIHECKQTLDLSAGTSINVQQKQRIDFSARTSYNVKKENLRVCPLFNEYFYGENQVVSKSSAVTTAHVSHKRQQQSDSTSSTSTLATTITVDGNSDIVILFSNHSDEWKSFQSQHQTALRKIVTICLTLTVLSALRCSGNENKQAWSFAYFSVLFAVHVVGIMTFLLGAVPPLLLKYHGGVFTIMTIVSGSTIVLASGILILANLLLPSWIKDVHYTLLKTTGSISEIALPFSLGALVFVPLGEDLSYTLLCATAPPDPERISLEL
ncbi:hypothetical protein Tco_0012908 [Tanacetum coccineum]